MIFGQFYEIEYKKKIKYREKPKSTMITLQILNLETYSQISEFVEIECIRRYSLLTLRQFTTILIRNKAQN